MSTRTTRLHPAGAVGEYTPSPPSQSPSHGSPFEHPLHYPMELPPLYPNQNAHKTQGKVIQISHTIQASGDLRITHSADQILSGSDGNTPAYAQLEIQQQQSYRRRVDNECDMCRVKKTKCDSGHPCSSCVSENRICSFTNRGKTEKMYPQHQVEMLETRVGLLSKCLEGLFKKSLAREDVSYMAEKDGSLAINKLMEELGLADFQTEPTGTQDEPSPSPNESHGRKGLNQTSESQLGTEQHPLPQPITEATQLLPNQQHRYEGYGGSDYQRHRQRTTHQQPEYQVNYNNRSNSNFQINIQAPQLSHENSSSIHQVQSQPGTTQAPQEITYSSQHLQTDVPIRLDETLFAQEILPPFEVTYNSSKHYFSDDFEFQQKR